MACIFFLTLTAVMRGLNVSFPDRVLLPTDIVYLIVYMYGNSFAFADEEAIINATHILDPPTTSNIIAMEVLLHTTRKVM